MASRRSALTVRAVSAALSPAAVVASCSTSTLARRYSTETELAVEAATLQRTPLYDLHVAHGGKMVPFGGFSMPLSYKAGPVAEHHHTRSAASLFDVSHMVQSRLHGKTATAFLAHLTPSSVSALQYDGGRFHSTLSVLLNEDGGIIDDLMITRQGEDSYYLVTNAARRDRDVPWIQSQVERWNSEQGARLVFETMDDHALVALQGPDAATVLAPFFEHTLGLQTLRFGQAAAIRYNAADLHVARSGYTGEDGFEISVPADRVVGFTEELLGAQPTALAGLAARDSLRLEAGLCLYGVDLDEQTSPIEAGLAWVVGKDRRTPGAFIGSETVLRHLKEGPPRRRVGMVIDKAPARHGAVVYDEAGEKELGVVTSGIPSPSVKQNIAMGYVLNGQHKSGTKLQVDVRGKKRNATICKMPFTPAHYFRG